MPSEFDIVIQIVNRVTFEPILVTSFRNQRQINYTFSENYYAIIFAVDRFGQSNYIGKILANPMIAGTDYL
jgi:hypothetical protein